jgi:hypothetical protein
MSPIRSKEYFNRQAGVRLDFLLEHAVAHSEGGAAEASAMTQSGKNFSCLQGIALPKFASFDEPCQVRRQAGAAGCAACAPF